MKKLFTTILASTLILGVSGCSSNKTTTVSDGSTQFFTVGNTTVTKDDVYTYMKLQNLDSGIIAMAEEDILESQVPVTDEMIAQADEMIAADKELYGEDTFNQMIGYYGFADEQAYKDAYLINMRMTELTQGYIEANWDSLIEQYKPIKANVLTFNEPVEETSETETEGEELTEENTTSVAQENATEALAALKDGSKDLLTVIEDYSLAASEEATIYLSNNTSLPAAVLTYLQTNQTGWCNEPIFDESNGTPKYYLINIVDNDANNMKEELLTSLSAVSEIAIASDQNVLRENNFFVYDQMILDALRANYNGYLTDEQQAVVQETPAAQ